VNIEHSLILLIYNFSLLNLDKKVPTMAIETIWIADNSSIIQDEVLSHRVGLIPIKADPAQFEYVIDEDETDADTLVFHLEYVCPELPPNVHRDAEGVPVLTKEQAQAQNVYSRELIWLPQGAQADKFQEGIKPVHDDILIAKLTPGEYGARMGG
jgi:DNA-directed RNA polymerases I and III subunit RPAC1